MVSLSLSPTFVAPLPPSLCPLHPLRPLRRPSCFPHSDFCRPQTGRRLAVASLSPPRARIDVNVSDHDAHIAVNLNEDDADFTKFKKDLPKNASELLKGAAYWEFEVNVAGKEKPRADTSFASEGICKAILEKDIEDVIVMSHGWNTARDKDYHYVDFNNKMAAALLANDPRKKRKVLIVGLCWPSHPLTAFAGRRSLTDFSSDMAKTDPKAAKAVREAVETIKASVDAPNKGEDSHKAAALPTETEDCVKDVARHLQEGSPDLLGSLGLLDTKEELRLPERSALQKLLLFSYPLLSVFGRSRAKAKGLMRHMALSRLLETVVFGQFQNRAATVGAEGVRKLLVDMMKAAEGKETRFHLIGHSLGSHVVSSAAIGTKECSKLPRKIQSMVMLQAAVPVKHYENNGKYNSLLSKKKEVEGVLVATTSGTDMALKNMEIFEGNVLGRRGFSNSAAGRHKLSEFIEVEIFGQSFSQKLLPPFSPGKGWRLLDPAPFLRKGHFFSISADSVINDVKKVLYRLRLDVTGSHNDLYDMKLQQMVWKTIDVGRDDDTPNGINEEGVTVPQYLRSPQK